MTVGIGIIGLGIHGTRYARHLLDGDVPGARLTAICRRDEVAGRDFAARHGVAFHAGPGRLIESSRVDAVVLVLPPTEHPALAIAALDAGKPVLVEKPLACDLEAARRVQRHVARTGGHLMMSHTLRFDGVVGALRSAASELGPPNLIAINQRFEPFHRDWIDTPGPGGILLNTAVHGFDLIRHLTGAEPVALSAGLARCFTRHTEDQFVCWMRLEPGAILATLDNSRTTAGRSGRIEIACERGQVCGDHVHRTLWRTTGRERIDLGPVPPVQTVSEALAEFVGGVRERRPPSIDVDDGLASIELVEAARQSAAGNRVVDLSRRISERNR